MKKIFNSFVSLSLVVFLFSGCASVVSKSQYPINISSEPQGADITIVSKEGNTVFSGKTPTTVTLKAGAGYFKGEDYTVTFNKDGFASHTAQIVRGVDGWYILGNIFVGGLIGWVIVDPATGAMWTLDNMHADLSAQANSSQDKTIHIVTLKDVPENLRSNMVKIN